MRCKQWIFDMDGTLTDSMTTVWRQAPIAMLEHFGCQARPGLRETLLSMTIPQAAEYLHQEYGLPMDEAGYTRLLRQEVNHLYQTVELKRETLLSMTIPQAAEYLHQEYGLPMDEAGYTRLLRQEVNHLYQTVELKPGVREMLARLAQQGARMCICSNTWEAQCREVLSRLGVESYFEFFITAQGEQSKRRPEVFLEAMQRLGGTDPACCAPTPGRHSAGRCCPGWGWSRILSSSSPPRASSPSAVRRSFWRRCSGLAAPTPHAAPCVRMQSMRPAQPPEPVFMWWALRTRTAVPMSRSCAA